VLPFADQLWQGWPICGVGVLSHVKEHGISSSSLLAGERLVRAVSHQSAS
jgi:hypothetical protein